MSFHSPSTPQKYREIIYDSGATQQDNVYNDIGDFFNAIADMAEGTKYLRFLSSVTAPSGAYNTFNCVLLGNGNAFDAGGITLTITTGTTFTGAAPPQIDFGLLVRTTSSNPVYTTSGAFTFTQDNVGSVKCTTAPFLLNTGGGQTVVGIKNSGRWLNDGYENYETTAGAFATTIVINYQIGAAVSNDTFRSTNAQVLVQVLDTVVMDASNFPTTHTNLSVGFAINLNRTYAGNLNWTPASKTANFSVTKSNSLYNVTASSSDITASLIPAIGNGEMFLFNPVSLSGNNMILDADGTDTIDGSGTLTIGTDGDAVMLIDAASGSWRRITP